MYMSYILATFFTYVFSTFLRITELSQISISEPSYIYPNLAFNSDKIIPTYFVLGPSDISNLESGMFLNEFHPIHLFQFQIKTLPKSIFLKIIFTSIRVNYSKLNYDSVLVKNCTKLSMIYTRT